MQWTLTDSCLVSLALCCTLLFISDSRGSIPCVFQQECLEIECYMYKFAGKTYWRVVEVQDCHVCKVGWCIDYMYDANCKQSDILQKIYTGSPGSDFCPVNEGEFGIAGGVVYDPKDFVPLKAIVCEAK